MDQCIHLVVIILQVIIMTKDLAVDFILIQLIGNLIRLSTMLTVNFMAKIHLVQLAMDNGCLIITQCLSYLILLWEGILMILYKFIIVTGQENLMLQPNSLRIMKLIM